MLQVGSGSNEKSNGSGGPKINGSGFSSLVSNYIDMKFIFKPVEDVLPITLLMRYLEVVFFLAIWKKAKSISKVIISKCVGEHSVQYITLY